MLRARKLVDADRFRQLEVPDSPRIDRVEGPGRFPVLDVAHRVDDLRASTGFPAPIAQPGPPAIVLPFSACLAWLTAEGVGRSPVRERPFRTRILLLGMLCARQPSGL